MVYLRALQLRPGPRSSILAGQNLIPLYNALGTQNLLNYIAEQPRLHRSRPATRCGAASRASASPTATTFPNIKTLTTAATNYFQYINFSGVAGPNSLDGIRTSHIIPSYTYNTVNHPDHARPAAAACSSRADFAGSFLGGNVNTVRPTIDVKYFKPAPWHKSHILAFHVMGSMITGYGGKYVPPFSRTFMGGEQDIRGFEIWGITPDRLHSQSRLPVNVLNDDGTRAHAEDRQRRRDRQRAGHDDRSRSIS